MTTQEPNDAELVGKALTGDQEAFAELVRKYQDYAYAAAVGVLADFDLAHDVVQEAFLQAWCDLARLREPEKFGGWLYGMVRHMARRARREVKQVRKLAGRMAAERPPVGAPPTPAQQAQRGEEREIVRRALAALGDRNREAISLYYVDGLSYEEIAGFLGQTEVTVQGRLQRGRKELRAALAKELEMVSHAFHKEKPADDFAAKIRGLLDRAAHAGQERNAAIKALADMGMPAVDSLCEAIGDPRVAVRRAAAVALCLIGDQRAVGPLFRALYAGDYWLGNPLFNTGRILALPGVKAELFKIIHQGKPDDQRWAMQALAHAKDDPEVWRELESIYRDRGRPGTARCQAVSAMMTVRPDFGEQLASEALADPEIRRHSGWIWFHVRSRGWKVPLKISVASLDRSVAHTSRWAAGELMLRHGEAGRKRLEELLASGTSDQRAVAAVVLGSKEDPGPFEPLIDELLRGHRERKWVRMVAAVLVNYFAPKLLEWVKAHPTDAAKPELAAAIAQARIRTGAAGETDMVRHGVPSVRAAALEKLGADNGAALLPELRAILREGRPRKLAQEAFWQMHALRGAAMPVVMDMAASEHWTERKAAASLLRRWDRMTEEQHARFAADPHIAVRHAADWRPNYVAAAEWHPKWKRRLDKATPGSQG